MKLRSYGALMGALLTISAVETAQAGTCDCAAKPPQHGAVPRRAPARLTQRSDDAQYAQSYYDYQSSSRVTERFTGRPDDDAYPSPYDDGFRAAPDDARIRFFAARGAAYSAPAYPQPYYTPPAAYYPPTDYYPDAPGVDVEQEGFNGGVGYGGSDGPGGGGGGYGGQAFLYLGQGGGSDVPPNGGGVNLPPGYGPTYHGVWQGPVNPTRGGLTRGGGR